MTGGGPMTPAKVRALRESRGETQGAFGASVAAVLRRQPIARETVNRWESGALDPARSDVPWHIVEPMLRS